MALGRHRTRYGRSRRGAAVRLVLAGMHRAAQRGSGQVAAAARARTLAGGRTAPAEDRTSQRQSLSAGTTGVNGQPAAARLSIAAMISACSTRSEHDLLVKMHIDDRSPAVDPDQWTSALSHLECA